MVITLCGTNAYEIHHAQQTLVALFLKKHGQESVSRLDGETCAPRELIDAVQSSSLFTSETMVILSHPSSQKVLFAELETIIPMVPESTTLLIIDGALDRRTKAYKLLKEKSDFHEANELDALKAQQWVRAYAKERGGTIEADPAKHLIEQVGSDQWQLAHEIDKLVAYNKVVSDDSIAKLVVPNLEARVFEVLDAAFGHQEVRLRTLLAQLRAAADPYELFGLLVWQVHALALVVSADAGQPIPLKPFVIQKLRALHVSMNEIKKLARQLSELDVRMKSGGDPWTLIEHFLLSLSQ
jgi:DNA polymerase III delta subunit